ncbi:hypothetical protein G7K_5866-t1 [Saitoella complicata NRRL Y-17804]|uniref:Uncharacterized protein n=1 Tax=Saitoella complicata (strain BCRC 22490 / CBS 7301 / JCM 7358 / NBRC 10748 / NRRL Y-17804) TaxID=698492 RepID=A0A0E9NPP1_SAICN|nr:hypothetical protein G7K_5866-t1 [Saitoella complicata NRRL Y-17804]
MASGNVKPIHTKNEKKRFHNFFLEPIHDMQNDKPGQEPNENHTVTSHVQRETSNKSSSPTPKPWAKTGRGSALGP